MIHLLDAGETTHRWLRPRPRTATGMLLAFLALLPFGGLYNVPLLALCVLGLWSLVATPEVAFKDHWLRRLLVVFLCIWLPMVIAGVDAVDPVESWRKIGSFPVFLLVGVYTTLALRRMVDQRLVLYGVLAICLFWSVDASWQFVHGFNLFGFPYHGWRVAGIFHPDLTLGVVLATVSPFVLEGIRRLSRRSAWVVLTLIPYIAAILLSGSRSSWIVLFLVLGTYGWYLIRWCDEPRVRARAILRVAAVAVLAFGVVAYAAPQTVSRMHGLLFERAASVAALLSGDVEKADGAIHARLSAWETAGRVFRTHWFNGVGPRGFRDVYADYAPASDPYASRGEVLTFPHLVVLEIAAETGMVGLLGYLVALAVLVRMLLDMNRTQLALGFPYWLAIVVALFPLATHKAFYAHFMGALIWWTIAISFAGLGAVMRSGAELRPQCAACR